VWEPRAGILQPEACLRVQLALAQRLGARFGFDEPLLHWEADATGVRLQTARRELRARQLVLCAGAWTNRLLPGAVLPLQVERQTLHWFEPLEASALAPARCPIHLWQFDGDHFFYGFPDLGDGAKAAFHHGGEITSVEAVRRDVQPAEVEAVRAVMRRFMPAADGPLRRSQVCLYTNTPDGHFWIDRLEQHPAVIVVSACSGHGFKFAPAIGELVADRVQERPSRLDASLFGRR
jgi:sarcosine oxidase